MDGENEEEEPLLEGFAGFALQSSSRSDPLSTGDMDPQALNHSEPLPEMALIAYFRRLTSAMLTTVADMIEGSGFDNDQDVVVDHDQPQPLHVRSADISRLGLDVWSAGDIKFAEELAQKYFGVVADAQGACIECCGIRIC